MTDKREIFDCEQGSDDWFSARLTMLTASRFKDVLNSKTGRHTYMMTKLTESQQGRRIETYQSEAMRNGIKNEPFARKYYEDSKGVVVEQVGFIKMGRVGCSPDGLVGDDGMIEIKYSEGSSHYQIILKDKMPTIHIPQVQGSLWVTGRKWCDFVSYDPWGRYKPFYCKRIFRDDDYINKILKPACEKFLQELNDIDERIRS